MSFVPNPERVSGSFHPHIRAEEACAEVPNLARVPFHRISAAKLTGADRAVPASCELVYGAEYGHQPCRQVPRLQCADPLRAELSAACPLDEQEGSMQCGGSQQRMSGGGDLDASSLDDVMDAQVPEIDVDSRRGSPCRLAAAELMHPETLTDFPGNRATSLASLGLASAQTIAEDLETQASMHVSGLDGSSHSAQAEMDTGADERSDPIPGLAHQPDWFTAMMEQAQSVGLWGGAEAAKLPKRAPSPPSGVPILPEHLLSQAASGVMDDPTDSKNPLAIYETGMASMLSLPLGQGAYRPQAPTANEGLGIISRDRPPNRRGPPQHQMPKLPPVSLGMPSSSLPGQQALGAATGVQQRNDGPFRPPTWPRTAAAAGRTAQEPEMLHPMLEQSKLQLSLGLAADRPLDLKGWGYGGITDASRDDQDRGGPGFLKVERPSMLPQRLNAMRPPSGQAPSDGAKPGSGPTTPCSVPQSAPAAIRIASMPSGSTGHQGGNDRPCTSMCTVQSDGSSRAESLERYREKRRRRLFSKTIRYHKRKVNADKRPRVKGRFVKATDPEASHQGEDDGALSEDLEDSLADL